MKTRSSLNKNLDFAFKQVVDEMELFKNFGSTSIKMTEEKNIFLNRKRNKSNLDKVEIQKNNECAGANKMFKICHTQNGEIFNDNFVDSLMYWQNNNPPGSGLNNLGNTCFLNSVLQCILYTPPLKNYFDFSDHTRFCKIEICIMCEYSKLAKMVELQNRSITPQNIIQSINNISHHIKIGRQEDAHEFLLYFLSAMENSTTNYLNSIQKKFTKIKNTNVPLFQKDNLIQKIFGGALLSSVTCKSCKISSIKIDKFIDISLDLGNENDSLLDSIENFCKPEELINQNKYFCEKCKIKNDSTKKFSFVNCIIFYKNFLLQVPRIFIFHLKRFDNYQRKVKNFLSYPYELKMDIFQHKKIDEKVSYRLCSVLVHRGNSISSGHYYCYVRASDHNWYCFNDHSVTKVNQSVVLRQNAYLLFYEKIIDSNKLVEDDKTSDAFITSYRTLSNTIDKKINKKKSLKQKRSESNSLKRNKYKG